MTLKASTGLRNKLLDTNPFRTIFNLGFIRIYDGPVPASADDAIIGSNHTLVIISVSGGGTGLTFESAAVSGAITKTAGETWSGTILQSGTASFYRLVAAAGETEAYSITQPRVQGSCGTSGADLNMTSVTLTTGSVPIDAFSIALPTL